VILEVFILHCQARLLIMRKAFLVVFGVEIRRRRWLISAQDWSVATTLGLIIYFVLTLKGFQRGEPFQG
jgi:hypothetical protein